MADPSAIAGISLSTLELIAGGVVTAIGAWIKIKQEARETRKEQAASLTERLRPIEAKIESFKPRDQLAEDRAAVEDKIRTARHELANDVTNVCARIHLLEQGRVADLSRMSVLEAHVGNLKECVGRVEVAVERNHRETLDAIDRWAEQFSLSIREVRDVRPRS